MVLQMPAAHMNDIITGLGYNIDQIPEGTIEAGTVYTVFRQTLISVPGETEDIFQEKTEKLFSLTKDLLNTVQPVMLGTIDNFPEEIFFIMKLDKEIDNAILMGALSEAAGGPGLLLVQGANAIGV